MISLTDFVSHRSYSSIVSFSDVLAILEKYRLLMEAVVGLVCMMLTGIATWVKDLNSHGRRLRTLDEATKRVAFWDAWSKSLAAIDSQQNPQTLAEKVKLEVIAAAESVERAFHSLAMEQAKEVSARQTHERTLSTISQLRRWFLLYKPVRWFAWIPRVFFYIYALEAPLLPFVAERQKDFAARLFMFLGLSLFAAFFRWLSVRVDKPRGPASGV